MKNSKKGAIIVVSAPSGTGKTTIVRKVLETFPQLVFSVSATTRKKRPNEKEGVHYFFLTKEKFEEKIARDEFVEWEKVYDYYYGTLKCFLEDKINDGKSVIFEVDVKGALTIKNKYPDSILIFITPPSFEELVKRLKNRMTEDEVDLHKRIERVKMELSLTDKFDYLVENKILDTAVRETIKLIEKVIKKENG